MEPNYIPSTLHKLDEANYFLARMFENYHSPFEFQFNLNAFIQAIRNVTFMLQSEEDKPAGFAAWYEETQKELRGNQQLRKFVAARNIIVKQSSLTHKSHVWSGLFRGRKLKLAIQQEIHPLTETTAIFDETKGFGMIFLDEEHSAIGEQLGIERTWIVQELGDSEVCTVCLEAFNEMAKVVSGALSLFGQDIDLQAPKIDMKIIQVILETDLDPSLIDKWGWN